MVTKNRRVAAYLPPHVDERFQEFKVKAGIKGDSEAFIKIIMEYLGVEHPVSRQVSFTQFSDLVKRLEALENAGFVVQTELDDIRSEFTKDIAMAITKDRQAKPILEKSSCDSSSVSMSEPLQTGLAINLKQETITKKCKDSDIPEELALGLSQAALAKRFGVDRKKIYRRRDNDGFGQWSSERDPVGITWEYRSDQRYYPCK